MTTQAQDTTVRTEIVVDAPRIGRSGCSPSSSTASSRGSTTCSPSTSPSRCSSRGPAAASYDRGVDGSECQWGRVLAYEPPDRIVFSWDINPMWQIETDLDKTSEVEVRFIADGPTRTRSSSSTATSTATATAGTACATAWRRPGLAAVPRAVRGRGHRRELRRALERRVARPQARHLPFPERVGTLVPR